MNNATEMTEKYNELFRFMAESKNPSNMKVFGNVMTEMMMWMIANKPEAAQKWMDELESIKWKNYLTMSEAESIVNDMVPKAPWSRDQWKSVMEKHEYDLEKAPCYNKCALWVTMEMIMSDSSDTIGKYVSVEDAFSFVYDMAVDKLTDEDNNFRIRHYFGLQ